MKYYQTIFLILVCILIGSLSISAQEVTEDTSIEETATTSTKTTERSEQKARVEQKREQVKGKIEAVKQRATSTIERINSTVCERVETRIDARLSTFGSIAERHMQAYEVRKTSALIIAEKLDGKGVDTTQLRADIATLNEKIEIFAADHAKVQAALLNVKSKSCAEKEDFKNALAEVRDMQKVVAEDVKDIRTFIMTTLKQNFIEIKTSLR